MSTLADRFEQIGNDFLKFIKANNLQEAEVDMNEGGDNRKKNISLCNTPACHGGWAAILYSDEIKGGLAEGCDYHSFYLNGAFLLSKKLGFEDEDDFEEWAGDYPELWGNNSGVHLFVNSIAFCKSSHEVLTLTEIANHYKAVAERIRESLKGEIS